MACVFRVMRADRVKVLWFDGTGPGLAYKRLEQGRVAWPSVQYGVMRLYLVQFEATFERQRAIYSTRIVITSML